ncbi:neurochondrin-like [Liolophura sinensis]|uniref:neurochondrin-like n=1 Tax=Liolophura sinensis TaxID=3198878 RepID=UPI0031589E81
MKIFFTNVLAYFSQIHTVMESGGSRKLVVAPKYAAVWDDVAELWFLATQAFGSCISIYPELLEPVLTSEWLPKLVKEVAMTTDSKTDSEINDVYLTLLSQLSRGHPEVKEVILTNGGLQLARSSGCAELEGALSCG